MNHDLQVNIIMVLAPAGMTVLPGGKVPPNLVFQVWSGQHRVEGAKKYLRDLMEEENPGMVFPVDAELDHEKAYWCAEVFQWSKSEMFFEEQGLSLL